MSDATCTLDNLSAVKLAALARGLRPAGFEARLLAREPIAVVGMACRFPRGEDLAGFQELLLEGRDAIGPLPTDRWDTSLYDRLRTPDGRSLPHAGAFLADVKAFDAAFFHISGREALSLDPQQRLLLEVVWDALEGAGTAPDRLAGSATGVFVGITAHDHGDRLMQARDPSLIDAYYGTGNTGCFAAGRIAHTLGLVGPVLTIDTACSSSLVAVHCACRSLLSGESERAIAAGVHLILSPGGFLYNATIGTLAPDGRSKVFADGANGFGRGEGCGALVLRRLSDALAEGDAILGLIRGSAVNHDGRSGGLTVPSGQAQEAVLRAALESAGIHPATVDLVEAHGTGTDLGDPIELRALGAVYGAGRPAGHPLSVGSVKTNVGHLESAAGVAGLIKALIAVRTGILPPSLHAAVPTSRVAWGDLNLSLVRVATPWTHTDGPRRAGVSSFGMSGTNAHLIVEEPPADPVPASATDRPVHVVALSARTEAGLPRLAAAEAAAIAGEPGAFADLAHTSSAGRAVHVHRAAVVAESAEEAAAALAGSSATGSGLITGQARSRSAIPVAFLFTGQGAVAAGMGRELYESAVPFADRLDRARAILADAIEVDLLDLLFGAHTDQLEQTRLAQPAIASLEWALAGLWRSFGLTPAAVLGHSLGEYVAAAEVGMIDAEDMLWLVAKRGRLMDELDPGVMLHCAADPDTVTRTLGGETGWVSLAAINGVKATVIAGAPTAVDRVAGRLNQSGVQTQRLPVTRAFHSAMMDSVLEPLTQACAEVRWAQPKLPLVSNVSGLLHPADQPPEPRYWARHARDTVRFTDGVETLGNRGIRHFLEIGPRPVLAPLVAAMLRDRADRCVASLQPGRSEWKTVLEAAAELWVDGAAIDWHSVDSPFVRRRRLQPTYPFERRPYWLETKTMAASPEAADGAATPQEPSGLQAEAGSRNEAATETAVVALVAEALKVDPDEIDRTAPLLELGADSLNLIEIGRLIQARFGVVLTPQQVFEGIDTAAALARYVREHARPPGPALAPAPAIESDTASAAVPPAPLPATAAKPPEESLASTEALADLFARQLDLLRSTVDRQLAILQVATTKGIEAAHSRPSAGIGIGADAVANREPERMAKAPDHGPYRPFRLTTTSKEPDPRRRSHLEALIRRYTARTRGSKERAAAARLRLADSRASAGFRPSIKEMLYPITGVRAEGARLWDVDGNAYVDISMDFGVNLLGHRAPVVEEAIREALEAGLAMAPRSPHAPAVADLLCRLTGMERVAFCQSGTEAVMIAVRLARLATGRDRIAIFRNSYHGHADGLLAQPWTNPDGSPAATTVAAGIPAGMVAEVVVLDYGADAALEYVCKHGSSLAAVLVEPVQSRAVDLQPRAFLRELRQVTRQTGTLLVFDEMITGFRLAQGGAQAWYGVAADLACYGKALGGGIQMAAVAGRGGAVDGVDGGLWTYGDDSLPLRPTTFIAGTFNGAPLAMATAHAVLTELERQGPALQERLNAMTRRLVDPLNAWFKEEQLPLEIAHAGSLFRFKHQGNLDLLYYHLLLRGVFVWEGRNCFLCTAHGEDEIKEVAEAVRGAIGELQGGAYLPERRHSVPVGAPRSLATSEAQRQLWLLGELEAGAPTAYVELVAFELTGSLDVGALGRAVAALPARHEALRATISGDGRQQIIAPAADLALEIDEALDADGRDAWLNGLANQPIPLDRAPAIRIALRREGLTTAVLALVAHHVLVDGWSLSILMQDLYRLYAWETGAGIKPEAPAGQLSDVIRPSEAALCGDRRRELETFWRKALDPLPDRIELPYDRGPATSGGKQAGRKTLEIPTALAESLAAFGRSHKATPFAVWLAVVTGFLHRLTGQMRFAIGFPVHGRGSSEAALSAVAYATHLLPLVSDADAERTFVEHLGETCRRFLQALKHQDYSYAELLRLLDLPWAADRSPLIDVTLNLDQLPPAPEAKALVTKLLSVSPSRPKFPLCLNLLQRNGHLVLDLDYDAQRLSPEAAAVLADQLLAFAESALETPAARLADLSLLGVAERRRLLETFNATAVTWDEDGLIHEIIDRTARTHPTLTAVRFDGRSLDYGGLAAASDRLAAELVNCGVGAESIVACCFDRSIELVVALLAVLKAGGAYLPLSMEDPVERIADMVKQAEPLLLLAQRGQAMARAEAVAGRRPVVMVDPIDPATLSPLGEPFRPNRPAGPDNPAYVLFTSGSTGCPKGVVSSHAGLRNRLLWMQQTFRLGPGHAVLQKTPYTFDVSVWEFFWPLMTGARLIVAEPGAHRDPHVIATVIQAEAVTHAHFVPSMLALFVEVPEVRGCKTLDVVVASGEALPRDLVDRFSTLGLRASLHNLYGPTEASIDVTHWLCVPDDSPAVPIGRPIANTVIRILDQCGELVPIGGVGEIHIGGVQLARGYLGRHDLTEAAFVPDAYAPGQRLYRTGDLGRWRADGAIMYLGRRDGQVKLRGQRIELGEIETTLRRLPVVRDAAVTVAGEGEEQRLVVFVVTAGDANFKRAPELPILSDGRPMSILNRGEVDFMLWEHVAKQIYFRHGIGLGPHAVVFDVGANVGVFALAVTEARPDATVFAFEPSPAVYAVLADNAVRSGRAIRTRQVALGRQPGKAALTIYPNLTILSSLAADAQEEKAAVKAFLQQATGEAEGIPVNVLDEMIADPLAAETIDVPVTTISAAMSDAEVDRIDLLKIDVEKSEADVLSGIAPEDWPRIRQVVVEVHDRDGRAAALTRLLESQGFVVVADTDGWAEQLGIRCLYARRPNDTLPPVAADVPFARDLGPLAAELSSTLAQTLPSVMVPTDYWGIDQIPLTAHGKVDRRRLAGLALRPKGVATPPPVPRRHDAPLTEIESRVADAFVRILGVSEVGRDDNFFRLGGHSLKAARLVMELRESFGVELKMKSVFDQPTPAAIAEMLARAPTKDGGRPAATSVADAPRLILPVDRKRRRHLRTLSGSQLEE